MPSERGGDSGRDLKTLADPRPSQPEHVPGLLAAPCASELSQFLDPLMWRQISWAKHNVNLLSVARCPRLQKNFGSATVWKCSILDRGASLLLLLFERASSTYIESKLDRIAVEERKTTIDGWIMGKQSKVDTVVVWYETSFFLSHASHHSSGGKQSH